MRTIKNIYIDGAFGLTGLAYVVTAGLMVGAGISRWWFVGAASSFVFVLLGAMFLVNADAKGKIVLVE